MAAPCPKCGYVQPRRKHNPTPKMIALFNALCGALNLTMAEAVCRDRKANRTIRRQVIAVALRSFGLTVEETGILMQRHHTTVTHSQQVFKRGLQGEFAGHWEALLDKLRQGEMGVELTRVAMAAGRLPRNTPCGDGNGLQSDCPMAGR